MTQPCVSVLDKREPQHYCDQHKQHNNTDGILPPKLCMGLTGPGPVLVSGQSTHLLVLQVKTTVNVIAQQNKVLKVACLEISEQALI